MLIQQIGEAQVRIPRSLHRQTQCHLHLAVTGGAVAGRAEACGLVEETSTSAVYAAVLPKVQRLEGVRCGCEKVYSGLVHHRVLLATEAGQVHLAAAEASPCSWEAGLCCLPELRFPTSLRYLLLPDPNECLEGRL